MNLGKRLIPRDFYPLTTDSHFGLDLVWWDGEVGLERSDPAGLNAHPQLELWGLDHAQESGTLVLKLATFFAGFAASTGRMVYHPRPGVALVLILSTIAAAAEVLDLAVVDGHAQDELSAPWLSPSMLHGGYSTGRDLQWEHHSPSGRKS